MDKGKTYSANYCWTPDHCVTLLERDNVTDPSSPSAWTTSDSYKLTAAGGNFVTGHVNLFRFPKETEMYTTLYLTGNADSACDKGHYVLIQPIAADSDGMPEFGGLGFQ
ncbi:hypothetical protein LX36DRAFT_667926 [Colletotrichum falcatum]|nr:hypothetical protein LX36DRAFT_667926 [Colletotrichum falcatum]